MKQSIQFWLFRGITLYYLATTSPTYAQIILRSQPVQDITRPALNTSISPWKEVDITNLFIPICEAYKGSRASTFIFTGRGGLPPSPEEALRSEQPLVDLGTPIPVQENRKLAAIPTKPIKESTPTPIVPAQGWIFNNNGEVTLTALVPNVPVSLGANHVPCHAAQQ